MASRGRTSSSRQSKNISSWRYTSGSFVPCHSSNRFTSLAGQDVSGFLPYDPEASVTNQVKSSFQTSLKQLQTTYLDSYVLHSPLRTFPQTLEAWRVLASLQDEGKVRKIGLSNAYDVNLIQRLGVESGRKVQVVQNRWFEGNGWDKAVVAWCKENDAQYQYVRAFWIIISVRHFPFIAIGFYFTQVILDADRLPEPPTPPRSTGFGPPQRLHTCPSPLPFGSDARNHSVNWHHIRGTHERRPGGRQD